MTASRLAGKGGIVTGASRGIGLAVTERLVREGARVCITARKADALREAVAVLGGSRCAIGVAGTADDPDHQRTAVAERIATFGSVDLLVDNTGINPGGV